MSSIILERDLITQVLRDSTVEITFKDLHTHRNEQGEKDLMVIIKHDPLKNKWVGYLVTEGD